MNKELSNIIEIYSTKTHGQFTQRLTNSSKESVIAVLTDLLTMYINDKNSSSLREFITVTLAGYEHSEKKIGFNGFKQSSIIGGKPIACEAKPKNIGSEDVENYRQGLRKSKPQVLNGGGNFTDYTNARFKKDRLANPNVLTSGFVDGKLLFIIEFPFNTKSFLNKLKLQLKRHFPRGDRPNNFLRSANFMYKDYLTSRKIRLIFSASNKELDNHSKYFDKKFLQKLLNLKNEKK